MGSRLALGPDAVADAALPWVCCHDGVTGVRHAADMLPMMWSGWWKVLESERYGGDLCCRRVADNGVVCVGEGCRRASDTGEIGVADCGLHGLCCGRETGCLRGREGAPENERCLMQRRSVLRSGRRVDLPSLAKYDLTLVQVDLPLF